MIMYLVTKQLWKAGYQQHNFDYFEKTWIEKNTLHYDGHTFSDSTANKYNRLKKDCITKTCWMYNQGDTNGTNHSANMVSDQLAAQMTAIKQHNDDLEEDQFKIADALHQLVGEAPIGGEGGILSIIDTKLMGTAPTEGNTDLSSLMA